MEQRHLKIIILMMIAMAVSCDEPETTVINYVHPDGSVTRRIEMKNKKNNFKPASVQVPYDSTWTVRDSLVVGKDQDTTWFRTAEKRYASVDELNADYLEGTDKNGKCSRSASFSKSFRWFSTVYRFSERVDKSLLYGYPLDKFMNKEEADFFYLPESVSEQKLKGPDSTRYKAIRDSIEAKGEKYLWHSVVAEWIEEFAGQTKGKAGPGLSRDSLKLRENSIVKDIMSDSSKSDSIVISRALGHESYMKFRTETDTATAIMERRFEKNISFSSYDIRFAMPGRVTGTNGFIDLNGEIAWPVKSDFFLSQDYIMWAESKDQNTWAWIVSGLFVLFVLSGMALRMKKG